jgi:tetratricopeptide (TPR) repeat protein
MTAESRPQLEEERDYLLASLRDLESERAAGELDEADYAALRADYTVRAAAVLRALEAPVAAVGAQPRAREARAAAAARRRTYTAVTVVLLIGGLAAGAVTMFAGQRQAGAPVTGSVPGDTQGRLSAALQLETQGKAVDALKAYDAILRDEPQNVQALAYRGWLLKRAGLPDPAMVSLDKAVAIDPAYPDAHFFRGMVLYQDRHDPAAAVTEFRAFMANNPPPEMVPAVQDVLKRAMADAGQPVP